MAQIYPYKYIQHAGDLDRIAAETRAAKTVALDFETTGFDPHTCRPRLLSLNNGAGLYVIDLFRTGTLGALRDVLDNPTQRVGDGCPVGILQNAKFDQLFFLHHFGVRLWPIFDTFRASALIYNGLKQLRHDLYALYQRELGIEPRAEDLGGSNWEAPELSAAQLDYSAEDVYYLPRLRDVLRAKVMSNGLGDVAALEFGAILPEASVEINGFWLNQDKWLQLYEKNRLERDKLGAELLQVLPLPTGQQCLPGMTYWNLESQPKLLASLRQLPGLKAIESTGDEVLAFHTANPVIKKVRDYRTVATRCKMFGPKYLDHINKKTGRIHPNYFPMLVTGRYAPREPNLGQIPTDKEYRACLGAPPGFKVRVADFSGIELRLMAQKSCDKKMLSAFASGGDPHRLTASICLAKAESEVTKKERADAKPVNFGFLYGMQAEKFVTYALANYDTLFTPDQAAMFRERYFDAYQGIAAWHRKVIEEDMPRRRATTTLGRYRIFGPEEYNEYFNHPIQGDGADGLKLALRQVYNRVCDMMDVRMVHHVHDEIILQFPDGDPLLEEATGVALVEGMRAGMAKILKTPAPEVETGTGFDWSCK